MIELVRGNEGTIFRIQLSKSPMLLVELMILSTNTTIPPIPENTKCKNIVTVYATFSLVNINDVAYVNGITEIG
jgi:hypothetical protein